MADTPRAEALEPLNHLVQELVQQVSCHPGFMWTPTGFEALHADWPTYPRGHGIHVTLNVLADFPPGTPLYWIDEIDHCSLFVVGRNPGKDPYDPQYIHVALWDEDLALCAKRDFVNGVEINGAAVCIGSCITLTRDGAHAALVSELTASADDWLLGRVIDYIYDHDYETAVREAALRVEVALREASGTSDFGQKLIDACFAEDGPLAPQAVPSALRKIIRSAFRCFFTYVRNEYAHKIPPTDMLTACRLVCRSSDLLRCVSLLKKVKRCG